jgi:glycosyltransferase involved in cell wall biosynthesis
MKFSIVIPTYEYKGLAPILLDKLFDSILEQTYTDFEVVVSDHSKDDVVFNHIQKYASLDIKYVKNDLGLGNSSVNMNVGIKNSNGEYIKIMHMDDWFCNPKTLELINDSINQTPNKKWGGVGFNHFYENTKTTDRHILPYVDTNIRTLIGCPSVSFFINDKEELNLYDENLIIINDSDMHIRLGKKYGEPILINEYCVTVRMSENQVSNQVSYQKHINEINYYQTKNFI